MSINELVRQQPFTLTTCWLSSCQRGTRYATTLPNQLPLHCTKRERAWQSPGYQHHSFSDQCCLASSPRQASSEAIVHTAGDTLWQHLHPWQQHMRSTSMCKPCRPQTSFNVKDKLHLDLRQVAGWPSWKKDAAAVDKDLATDRLA